MTHRVSASVAAWLIVLALAGSARADVGFDRAFGVNVNPTGGTEFESCRSPSPIQVSGSRPRWSP